MIKVGTKSILFGVHQFFWHPVTVLFAWYQLYGLPTLADVACIVIHDWGYWKSPNMDGEEGVNHPECAASIAMKYLGSHYRFLCLYHSRYYARKDNALPSKLCWADKLSIKYDPWWFYIPRAKLSGELKEYREMASESGHIPLSASNREWYEWARARAIKMAKYKNADIVPYDGEV